MSFKEAENNICQPCRVGKIMPDQRNPRGSLKICFCDYFPCFEADCNFPLHMPLFGAFVLHRHGRQEPTHSTPSSWAAQVLAWLATTGKPLGGNILSLICVALPVPSVVTASSTQSVFTDLCSDLRSVVFPSIFLPRLHCNP